MTTDLLALLTSDLAAGILAAADLREQRAQDGKAGPYVARQGLFAEPQRNLTIYGGGPNPVAIGNPSDAERIAALLNADAAAVRRWRGVVERHKRSGDRCMRCAQVDRSWPCLDLHETADEARAYLGGAS